MIDRRSVTRDEWINGTHFEWDEAPPCICADLLEDVRLILKGVDAAQGELTMYLMPDTGITAQRAIAGVLGSIDDREFVSAQRRQNVIVAPALQAANFLAHQLKRCFKAVPVENLDQSSQRDVTLGRDVVFHVKPEKHVYGH